jgi:hypothetical protein
MTDPCHPALDTNGEAIPALTLVLPADTGPDLAKLAEAVCRIRADLAAWLQFSRRRRDEYAAAGDQLGQAMARGQIVAGEHAIAHLDENIIETFGLWEQYHAQVPAPAAPGPAGRSRPGHLTPVPEPCA